MKISIITVCFNAELDIAQCLASVARQTHPDIEHIVIDGASKDRTVDIVRGFTHIAELVSEPDKGIYDAMNKGIARANGDFVLFLNADDTLPATTTLSTVAEKIAADPGADVYYGWLEVRPLDGGPIVFRPPVPSEAARFMVCGCLPHQSTLARPSVFATTGRFDLRYRFHADYDWFLKILGDPTIDVRLLPCLIGSFREGGASSQLANGQPEVYTIQNTSPLYAGESWDRARIAEFQKTLLNERLENSRLREEIRKLRPAAGEQLQRQTTEPSRLDVPKLLRSRLPRPVLDTLRRLRTRAWP